MRLVYSDFIENLKECFWNLQIYTLSHLSRTCTSCNTALWRLNRSDEEYTEIWTNAIVNPVNFIQQERFLIEKKGLDWVSYHFDRDLLFEKFNILYLESLIIYHLYFDSFFLVFLEEADIICEIKKFRKNCEESCFLEKQEREKKTNAYSQDFFKKNKKFLQTLEKISSLKQSNEKDLMSRWNQGSESERVEIIIKNWNWFLTHNNDEFPFPHLLNYMQTDEIKFFLTEKQKKDKNWYYQDRFPREKKWLLEELSQRESIFWNKLETDFLSSDFCDEIDNCGFFTFYKENLLIGELTFKKETNPLLKIAFKKLAEQHNPTGDFFRKFIYNNCILRGNIPERYDACRYYSNNFRLHLNEKEIQNLERSYQLNKRKEKILFHYAWCRTCFSYPFGKICPYKDSKKESIAKRILSEWKKEKKRELEKILICKVNSNQWLSKEYLDYLKEIKKIKESAFKKANELAESHFYPENKSELENFDQKTNNNLVDNLEKDFFEIVKKGFFSNKEFIESKPLINEDSSTFQSSLEKNKIDNEDFIFESEDFKQKENCFSLISQIKKSEEDLTKNIKFNLEKEHFITTSLIAVILTSLFFLSWLILLFNRKVYENWDFLFKIRDLRNWKVLKLNIPLKLKIEILNYLFYSSVLNVLENSFQKPLIKLK